MKEHPDLTASEDIHFPKGWDEASSDKERVQVRKTDGTSEFRDIDELGATGPEGPPGTTLTNILVASINLPIELASVIGTTQGDILLVHEQAVDGPNPFATYTWDTDAGTSTFYNPPFTIPSTGGVWVNTGSGFHQGRLGLDAVSASTFHGSFRHVHREARSYFLHAGTQAQLLSRVGYNRSALTGTQIDFFEANDDIYKTKTLSANTTLTFVGYQQNDTRYLEIDSPANETLTFPSYVKTSGVYASDGRTNYIQLEVIDEGTYSTGTLTVIDNSFDSGDAFAVNGVNFLFGTDWQSGASAEESAWNIATAISNSNSTLIKGKIGVSISGAVITLTDRQGGVVGDTVTMSVTDNATTNFTISGATLSGGVDGIVLAMITQEGSPEDTVARGNLSTGLITGCELTVNADPTKFDMAAGIGIVVDHTTTPGTPAVAVVNIPEQLAVTIPDIATRGGSFISVDASATIIQLAVRATPTERRDLIGIGGLSHINMSTLDGVSNSPIISDDVGNQLADLFRALGFFNISGNEISGIGASLTIAKASGTAFAHGVNFQANPKDPHTVTLASQSPASMVQILQNSTVIASSATIDPTNYDNAGVLTTVSDTATIGRVYMFSNNLLIYMFGQEQFSSLSDAINAAGSESFIEPANVAAEGLLLARIVLDKGASDITDSSEARIISGPGLSAGGGTINTLQESYNVSPTPEMVLDNTRGAFSIRDALVPIEAPLLEVQNNSGSEQYLQVNTDSLRTDTQAYSTLNTLTDSVSIATDCADGNVHTVTLTDNRTLSAPTNLKAGATYLWFIVQDITGSRTLAYNAVFKFPGGTTPVLDGTAGDLQILSGVSDGTNVYVNLSPEYSP